MLKILSVWFLSLMINLVKWYESQNWRLKIIIGLMAACAFGMLMSVIVYAVSSLFASA